MSDVNNTPIYIPHCKSIAESLNSFLTSQLNLLNSLSEEKIGKNDFQYYQWEQSIFPNYYKEEISLAFKYLNNNSNSNSDNINIYIGGNPIYNKLNNNWTRFVVLLVEVNKSNISNNIYTVFEVEYKEVYKHKLEIISHIDFAHTSSLDVNSLGELYATLCSLNTVILQSYMQQCISSIFWEI